jgi:hypothetical protein
MGAEFLPPLFFIVYLTEQQIIINKKARYQRISGFFILSKNDS